MLRSRSISIWQTKTAGYCIVWNPFLVGSDNNSKQVYVFVKRTIHPSVTSIRPACCRKACSFPSSRLGPCHLKLSCTGQGFTGGSVRIKLASLSPSFLFSSNFCHLLFIIVTFTSSRTSTVSDRSRHSSTSSPPIGLGNSKLSRLWFAALLPCSGSSIQQGASVPPSGDRGSWDASNKATFWEHKCGRCFSSISKNTVGCRS